LHACRCTAPHTNSYPLFSYSCFHTCDLLLPLGSACAPSFFCFNTSSSLERVHHTSCGQGCMLTRAGVPPPACVGAGKGGCPSFWSSADDGAPESYTNTAPATFCLLCRNVCVVACVVSTHCSLVVPSGRLLMRASHTCSPTYLDCVPRSLSPFSLCSCTCLCAVCLLLSCVAVELPDTHAHLHTTCTHAAPL
jgi:hypothetical protein